MFLAVLVSYMFGHWEVVLQDHKVHNLQGALQKGGKYMSLLAVFSLLHNLPTSSFYQTYYFCQLDEYEICVFFFSTFLEI